MRAAGLLAMWATLGVQAHEADGVAIQDRGLRITVAAAAALTDARDPLPAAAVPGVLGTGKAQRDRRGLRLEHAAAGLAFRHGSEWGAALAVGVHDRDRAHVETAWLQAPAWGELSLGAGRRVVPTTPAVTRAGHFDVFALRPLIKQALFEGDWIEDGVALAWQPHGESAAWPDRAGAGIWRGRAFPAGGRSPQSVADHPVTLNVGWDIGDTWQLDVFGAHMRPVARGSLIQAAGHTHGAPACDVTVTGRVCLDGRVALGGASVAWAPGGAWTLAATAMVRDERGDLYSETGNASYQGRTSGGWLEAAGRLHRRWELAGRVEHLTTRHDLYGPGASLVAADAGLLEQPSRRRLCAALAWLGRPQWRVAAEVGDDRSRGTSNPYVMLRWTTPPPMR